ncbi:hypothetical protein [Gordonia aichiensis]|uniref:RlpA-like protein double-psi beta-barrel domain-containing protein n=1 Tax=Gordonia aichiensis NBRC 108223 TaxID=1220583 RepID=L7KNI0_9ACTN|nr:hypothetical protein [Gordonia aichiensis]GAC50046.1 hypothetical protein GOACH_19_00500 [Gordonia aichiensis NBRC 108223]
MRTALRTAVVTATATAAFTLVGSLNGEAHAAPQPPFPTGHYSGQLTGWSTPANAIWFGKDFTGATVINDTIAGRIVPADVYRANSVVNGRPVIVVDYARSGLPGIRDELTSDGRGGYNGIGVAGSTPALTFTLRR